LSAETELELIALCGGVGLGIGGLSGSLLERSSTGGVIWGLGGALTGALGGWFTSAVIATTRGRIPEELCAALAWGVAGLFAGVAGYCRSRVTAPEPPDDPSDDADDTRVKRPRVFWVRGTPAGRLVPVFAVAAGCVVASLVSPPSTAGWAVVAVGLLGLAVGCALVGQERRIAVLERRLREVSEQSSNHRDTEAQRNPEKTMV
jgi:hypothetical protein